MSNILIIFPIQPMYIHLDALLSPNRRVGHANKLLDFAEQPQHSAGWGSKSQRSSNLMGSVLTGHGIFIFDACGHR